MGKMPKKEGRTENLMVHLGSGCMTSARHSPNQIKKADEGIIQALQGERWLNAKQIRSRMAESRIYVTGQFVSQRCRILEGKGKIERLDYNSGKSGGRQCWRLSE